MVTRIKTSKIARWTARGVGLLYAFLLMSFMIGEAIDGLFKGAGVQLFLFAFLLLICIASYFLAWVKPMRGGFFLLLGGVAMVTFHLLRHDWVSAMVYGIPFIFCGVLFMYSEPRSEPYPDFK